ncbi:hypothetical protein K0U83_09630 [bacterium]|nr:hypothetical protein [bacterium]
MRATEKRAALSTVLNAQGVCDGLRTQLRAIGDAIGDQRSKKVDALFLKLASALDEGFLELAQAPVDPEARTPEQQAADAAAAGGTP